MIVVKLLTDVEGLGALGDLVIADRTKNPSEGEWVVVMHDRGAWCTRYDEGTPSGAAVVTTVV